MVTGEDEKGGEQELGGERRGKGDRRRMGGSPWTGLIGVEMSTKDGYESGWQTAAGLSTGTGK